MELFPNELIFNLGLSMVCLKDTLISVSVESGP